ncbi:putative RING finger protein [Colletotrichum spaethianum]|uniref:RING-type E3 ubiquitin transferase n=1 Tax=Colletotrichum spaethianum TaxID=700344 RepID=A0AA37PA43_9PEZI|nr:putative RING finger protein [Colletotrichum spaethianum]GKT48471.1 putative RING finger protein [Colletotrichum spaethianum]
MSLEAATGENSTSRDLHSAVLQTTLQEISSRSTELQDCCVICLEEITEGCEAQPCHHHNFDYLCLVTWLEQQTACPLCKTEIKEVRYDFSDDRQQWKTFKAPERLQEKPKAAGTSPPSQQTRRFYSQARPRRPRPNAHPTRTFTPSQDEVIARRRAVYRNQLYSLHVGSNRISRYRDLTPQLFASDAELVSRARTFLRRELQVFEFLSPDHDARSQDADPVRRRRANNAEFLLEYIIAILKTVDMQGSMGQAEELIQEFLGRENTRLLLHELRAWLRSPYMSLESWDRAVQYPDVVPKRRRSQSPGTADRAGSSEGAEGIYPSRWRRDERRRYRREPYESRRSRNDERLREATARYTVD